ncbi:T9SS type A sorting domain-containing protein [Winogradskyella psychrotolerans]|nr:T9SS type A sorting domain-containing protein [Winogradskyella psychrotolerans]
MNNTESINVSDLSNGVYFLEIQFGNTKTVKRFIKS